ncbi:hypothetical protein [Flaviaesturariibacter amylovorans]|uniref:DUF5666 domain-containing protein n=1 Tax=Flaviaesturariibacter amylovorans TaxID=1084520 RepID=A0ABP8G7V7_9BACT
MKRLLAIILLVFVATTAQAQRPKDGRYTYALAFAEWNGDTLGETCIVIIKGDRIKILKSKNSNLTGKGNVIDEGMLLKHAKTGHWIIAHRKQDQHAPEVGGCSDGPRVIDFKKKTFWTC